jgi:ABC-2 type transport system permease protein
MMRYLRLWRRFLITAFVREAEYRFNFAVSVAEGTAQLVLAVLTVLLIYQFTPEVAGWTRGDLIMLTGIYRLVESLIALQIAPNLLSVPEYIRSGEMDFLLLRPVSSQFLVSLRRVTLPEVANALVGLALALYARSYLDVHIVPGNTALGIVHTVLFVTCGLIMLYAVWFVIVTLSFWVIQVSTLDTLFYSLFETGRYPVTFFKGFVRTLLVWIFPVAFATTFSTRALAGETDTRLALVAVALASLALYLSHRFWNFAVRHYSSASS